MNVADWQAAVRAAVQDLSTNITVSLDGLDGASTYSQVMSAAQKGATSGATAFNWEMAQLYQAGRLSSVYFVRAAQAVANPFK